MTVPNLKADHPHRVSLTKPMLAKHIRTAEHPYGRCLEDEVNIRRWSKDELSAVHFHLHNGHEPRTGGE